MRLKKADRQLLVVIGLAVCVALLWWAVGRGSTDTPPAAQARTSTTSPSSTTSPGQPSPTTSTDTPSTPVSGLATIRESQLPREGRATLALLRAGGPYPYRDDDAVFENRERLLPDRPRGYYREYTVETPGSDDRGARRIVGGDDGDLYYTDDHYDSFEQIEASR